MSSSTATSSESVVRLRSIHVSPGIDAEQPVGPLKNIPQSSTASGLFHCSKGGRAVRDANDADKKDVKNPFVLPQSTHTVSRLLVKQSRSFLTSTRNSSQLLFTESADTLPFWFAVAIAATSFLCLGLAFANNLFSGATTGSARWNIPGEMGFGRWNRQVEKVSHFD